MSDKGLLIVYFGEGEAPTFAVMGLAFRSLGREFRVCVINFNGGHWDYGCLTSGNHFASHLKFYDLSHLEFGKPQDGLVNNEALKRNAEFVRSIITSGEFQMVILAGLADLEARRVGPNCEFPEFLSTRPDNVHVVITGSSVPDSWIEAADLVTEMKESRPSG